jgi:predicted SprT family Zn-dependent metalloprotease
MTLLPGPFWLFLSRAHQGLLPFTLKHSTPRARHPLPSKSLDPMLEGRVREVLQTVAPELSPRIRVGWNRLMRTTAGVAVPSRWEIWLNPALREISEVEVQKTLLHELAHLLVHHRHGRRRLPPHGIEWREACRDLGIPGEGRTHQLPFQGRRMRRRFQLKCRGCGDVHERVRLPKGRIACLSCCRSHNHGLYDERFRFQIIRLDSEENAR